MADLTHLDSQSLARFKKGELADFIRDLAKIRENDAGVLGLKSILAGLMIDGSESGLLPPLAIGLMGGDDTVYGATLIKTVQGSAKGIDDIFVSQKTIFDDIDSALQETLDKLLKNQGGSLETVDGAKFLDIFTDVADDLSDGSRDPASSDTGSETEKSADDKA
ncbi:type VII secretion system-associated protein [Streptomyces tendae]|uniref:type VII secretion system-associated protein n=1 Tax=Streptomyces tendae TaxID=1932 RepID=UPI003D707B1B